ncbi:MAG: threonine/serine exporter family protein [Clostridia bacterium]|nr:threonine/serine exporter family protein [Clostridia bacterium]
MTKEITELICALAGSLGFSLLFNIGKRNLLPASLGGMFGWGVYLLCMKLNINIFAASIITAAFCQLYSEILAIKLEAPTTIFCIPAVVPLIPGSSLYYTLYYGVLGDGALCADYAFKTLKFTFGIAVGISFVSAAVLIFKKLRRSGNGN